MISKFKQILLLILILNQSKASFQSYYWISSQTQNLNSIQWDTICSCCSFQYELCGLETILVINQCSLNDYNQIVITSLPNQTYIYFLEVIQRYSGQLLYILHNIRIDEWNDYDFDVYLDYQRVHSNQYSHITSNQNICRNSLYNDELYPISITIPHTMTSITVMLVVERGIWGISQMILEAKLCPVDCESCIENQCLDQFLHFSTLVQQLVVNSSEGWLTNNQIQTTIQTFLQAKFLQPNANHLINEIELIPHQAISIQIKVLIYNSNPTEINIEIDDVLISRTQYTEGWIKYKNGYGYRSQKSISIHQYPHINDKAKISISLQLTKQEPTFSLYFAIRDFQLFLKSSLFEYPCNDDNLLPYDGCFQKNFDCIEGCSNCVRGLCLDCKVGWEYFEKEYLCIPICGDLIITFNEECDDGNNILYDGCYQCKHSCPQNCRICEFGKCLECNVNYQLSSNKKQCNSICFNDVKILNGIFQYQSSREWDSNQQCQQSCQLECKLCIDNNCYQCIDGWKLENNECNKFCGDEQVAINSIELCDDGNYNDNDGCYQCQFECIPYCYFCSNQTTCLFCQQYFILQDNQCLPNCGDGIIIQDLEECEDLNDKPYDGCYQCKYSCIQNCEICQLGICLQCNKGYIIFDNFCMNLNENQEEIENQDENEQLQSLKYCGDGIIQKYEPCDDFNQLDFDGCSISCLVENLWNCRKYIQSSRCYPQTYFTLSNLNYTRYIEYVQMSFSNKLIFKNYIENYTTRIIYKIDNLTYNQYELQIFQIYEIQDYNFFDLILIFQITFFHSIDYQPILRVSLKDDILDQNYFQVISNEQQIVLQSHRILTESQLQTAINLKTLSFWMLIGLCICAFIMFILGDIKNFTEILDILQFQSNLKFINVPFPQNVEIFFESSNFVTIKTLFNKLYLLDLFDNTLGFNHCESVGKFKYYNINADLLNNMYGFITQLLLIITINIFLRQLKKSYYNSHNLLRFLNLKTLNQSNILKKIAIFILNLTQNLIKQPFFFSKFFFYNFLLVNSWDLLFKILLYLVSNKETTVRSIFSYILSYGFIILVISFLTQYFRGYNLNIALKKIRQNQFEAILLFKKFMFLMILIGMQDQPIFQCIMLAVLIFTYLFFINTIEFLYQNAELINIIWQDAPVMIFTLSSLAYCLEFYRYLTIDQYFILGFIQIGFLIFGLTGPLVRCIIKFYQKIQYYFKNRKSNLELDQKNQTANPNLFTEIRC